MDAWLPVVPYYVASLACTLAAATHAAAIKKRLREPYYTYEVAGSSAWAVAFLLLAITVAAPHHLLRAEAATLIRSLFLAGAVLQLLWLGIFARAMVGVKRA